MAVINTNYLALVSQNNLNKSQSALGSAIERLSSGLRINSAKDDAAGQAIANRFTANIKGLTQASRNANDGISLAQTTEGALNEINNNLQRVRELTVQAQNGSNSASDIDSIQEEVNQRLQEIDRIAQQTNFNGIKVLDANTDQKFSIQIGAEDNEVIDIQIAGNGTWNLRDSIGTIDKSTFAQVNGEDRTVHAEGFNVLSNAADSTVNANITDLEATAAWSTIDGAYTGSARVVSYSDLEGKTRYAITSSDATDTDAYALTFDADGNATVGNVLLGADDVLARNSSTTIANAGSVTAYGGSDALTKLDAALQAVDRQRSDLGAIQNRFESTIANLNNTITNLSAARSRIEDADYAVEVSNMTRAQILQQAGTAVLAQANQVPQTMLSLLR